MSAIEEKEIVLPRPPATAKSAALKNVGAATQKEASGAKPKEASIVTKFLALLSSVRFGIVLLVLLVIASMIGMLVVQQNVEGFDKYFFELSPATKVLFGALGFFDIYHTWYFNVLLLVLSLNIILASIDRFPKAWTFIARPKLDASAHWLKGQDASAVLELKAKNRNAVVERITASAKRLGLKTRVTEKNGKTFVFAEKGAWNRLGAYAVHVALLTIFAGGFMTAQFGQNGQMPLKPGTVANSMTEYNFKLDTEAGPQIVPHNIQLPFQVTCTDIEQKLIKKDGPITADNTIDWLTRIKIKDETGEHSALVHLNEPYDYRGYRFFQASFVQPGRARQITLNLIPEAGGEPLVAKIPRDGSVQLPDGTKIDFVKFIPTFQVGQEDSVSEEYANPAAILNITRPDGKVERGYAFANLPANLPSNAPIGRPVAGYKIRLADYEKVPDRHVLSIQRDPGATVVYVGFASLALTLIAVFAFSHQRFWALIEEKSAGDFAITIGGNTNRNKLGFQDRFKKLVSAIAGEAPETSEAK
jgi:cytochrome c biogenesis protein